MKLNALTLLVSISAAYAGSDKELAQPTPTVGQTIMRVLKNKFLTKHNLQANIQKQQGKPLQAHSEALDDAQQLLFPGRYNLSYDVV